MLDGRAGGCAGSGRHLPGGCLWVQGGLACTLLHRGEFAASCSAAGAARRRPVAHGLLSAASAQPRDSSAPATGLVVPGLPGPGAGGRAGGPRAGPARGKPSSRSVRGSGRPWCSGHPSPAAPRGGGRGGGSADPAPPAWRRSGASRYQVAVVVYQGWVHTHRGQIEQGIAEMRRGSARLVARCSCACGLLQGPDRRGAGARRPRAGGPGYAGERAEAGGAHGGAMVRGGAAPAQGGAAAADKAERCLEGGERPRRAIRQAIAVAQGQEAKSWELRATTSLARLLRATRGARPRRARCWRRSMAGSPRGSTRRTLVEAKTLLEELLVGASC